jgi:multiple sugar transport system permease protein
MAAVASSFRVRGRPLMLALISVLFVFYVAGPVYWLAKTSLEPEALVTAVPPTLLPQQPSAANFEAIFRADDPVTYANRRNNDVATGNFVPSNARNLLPSLWNSLIVGLSVAFLNIVLSAGAAYAIAQIKFRGRDVALYSILVSRVIPDIALIVPLFLLMRGLGVLDTRSGLVATYLALTVPFTTFILINYFRSIPIDLHKAARVDGCSHLGVLWHVYLPLAMPAIVASLMFAFLTSWNEFLFALILTKTIASQVLPIVISSFVLDFTTNFSFVNAAGVLAIVPPVVLAILFERYIVSGLTAGAVKG